MELDLWKVSGIADMVDKLKEIGLSDPIPVEVTISKGGYQLLTRGSINKLLQLTAKCKIIYGVKLSVKEHLDDVKENECMVRYSDGSHKIIKVFDFK